MDRASALPNRLPDTVRARKSTKVRRAMKPGSFASLALLLFGASGCSNVSGAPADAGSTCIAPGENDGGDDDTNVGENACQTGDTDGINGGCFAFTITVDDNGFSPIILKAQNHAEVIVTVKNVGTKPHDFSVGCIATTNLQGCPPQTCFPAASSIPPLAPGASANASFVTPKPEGIYLFRSDVEGDSNVESDGGVSGIWGQLVVQ
jgi:hypothetical protein